MNEDAAILYAHIECRNFLDERRRRRTGFWQVLVAVPRTGDAPVENLAFTERTVLVLADVRDGADFAVVLENRDAFAG
jgi:hypothetical protein